MRKLLALSIVAALCAVGPAMAEEDQDPHDTVVMLIDTVGAAALEMAVMLKAKHYNTVDFRNNSYRVLAKVDGSSIDIDIVLPANILYTVNSAGELQEKPKMEVKSFLTQAMCEDPTLRLIAETGGAVTLSAYTISGVFFGNAALVPGACG